MSVPVPPPELSAALLAVQDHSPLLIALFDAQDVLRHANAAFQGAYGVAPDGRLSWADMMRLNHRSGCGAVIRTDDIEAWLASVTTRRGKRAYRAFEVDFHDGRWVWMTETTHQGWMLLVGSDITGLHEDGRALRLAHDQAVAAAQTDPLSGLSNRRHGLQLLRAALAQHETRPVCMALLDLDHFKQINDELGHAAGDQVICDFARHLQASVRREDCCARIGGEEFMLVLPATDMAQARSILERLHERVQAARPIEVQPLRGYGFSGGLVRAQAQESTDELMVRADAALYRAKLAGRGRVEPG